MPSPTCRRAVLSLRNCARLNLRQAREAKAARNPRLLAYRFRLALQCRADANALASTAR